MSHLSNTRGQHLTSPSSKDRPSPTRPPPSPACLRPGLVICEPACSLTFVIPKQHDGGAFAVACEPARGLRASRRPRGPGGHALGAALPRKGPLVLSLVPQFCAAHWRPPHPRAQHRSAVGGPPCRKAATRPRGAARVRGEPPSGVSSVSGRQQLDRAAAVNRYTPGASSVLVRGEMLQSGPRLWFSWEHWFSEPPVGRQR